MWKYCIKSSFKDKKRNITKEKYGLNVESIRAEEFTNKHITYNVTNMAHKLHQLGEWDKHKNKGTSQQEHDKC